MSVIDDEANGLYPSPASLNMDDHTAEHRMSELQFMLRDALALMRRAASDDGHRS